MSIRPWFTRHTKLPKAPYNSLENEIEQIVNNSHTRDDLQKKIYDLINTGNLREKQEYEHDLFVYNLIKTKLRLTS